MYDEDGMFCPLYTSAEHNEDVKCMFGNREYYDYDDFGSRDFIAPTISQVLKWLREEKKLHISIEYGYEEIPVWDFEIRLIGTYGRWWTDETYSSYELAVFAGIEYVIDNLI